MVDRVDGAHAPELGKKTAKYCRVTDMPPMPPPPKEVGERRSLSMYQLLPFSHVRSSMLPFHMPFCPHTHICKSSVHTPISYGTWSALPIHMSVSLHSHFRMSVDPHFHFHMTVCPHSHFHTAISPLSYFYILVCPHPHFLCACTPSTPILLFFIFHSVHTASLCNSQSTISCG